MKATLKTNRGDTFEATYCIMATGPLSVPPTVTGAPSGWSTRAPCWPCPSTVGRGCRCRAWRGPSNRVWR